MTRVENEIAVQASPAEVWRLLTDFPRYRDWHPFIRLAGEAKLGGPIVYEYTSVLKTKRARHSPAIISQFEPGAAFEWTMGIRRFFEQVETYELAPHPLGAQIRHRIEYRGMVGFLFKGAASRAAHARICEADDALRSYLGKTTRKAQPPVRQERGFRKRRR